MSVVAAACSFLIATTACLLFLRLRSARLDGMARLRSAAASDDFPNRILQLIQVSIDTGLLANAGTGGLADIEVRSREQSDPYRTAATLIDWLANESNASDYSRVCGVIKGVYQLGYALRAPDDAVRDCLEPLIARVKSTKVGGSRVARVDCIRQGAMLDPGTMAPLNYGARVTQPLGVLVYDEAGKVLGKAKVLCG
jgi:hypothetical protein